MDEEAREGYRAAIQMISSESKAIWDSFRSLLAANTILVGLSGAVLELYPQSPLSSILAIIGLIVTVAWALITARTFDLFKWWFAWARHYEKLALGSETHMIQRGVDFVKGEIVGEPNAEMRMCWASRLFRVEWLLYVVICAFLVVYSYLFLGVV